MRKRIKTQGFILLVVVIITHILCWLSLLNLNQASWIQKLNLSAWQYQINKAELDGIFNLCSKTLRYHVEECLLETSQSSENLKIKPLVWWKQFACSGNSPRIRYYYVIELLDHDVCAIVLTEQGQFSADFYRLTIMALPVKPKEARYVVQGTIVVPSNQKLVCHSEPHIVKPGLQMQRYL